MSLLTAKDEYITCPYQVSHRILLSRFQTHLVRCENAYKKQNKTEYVDCPFNATHKIMKLSLNAHTTYFCPDRRKIDTFIYKNEADAQPAVPLKDVVVEAEISENWDDADEPTYNPEEHVLDKPILLLKQCVSASERKAFRMQERLRHQEFENTKPVKNNENKRPSNITRVPQTSSRIANVGSDDVPTPIVSNLNGLSISDSKASDNDGFIIPKYTSKGRGRGRITKN